MITDPPAVLITAHRTILGNPGQFNLGRVLHGHHIAAVLLRGKTVGDNLHLGQTGRRGIHLGTILIQNDVLRIHANGNRLLIGAVSVPVELIIVGQILFSVEEGVVDIALVYNAPQRDILGGRFIGGISKLFKGLDLAPTGSRLILVDSLIQVCVSGGGHLDPDPPAIGPAANGGIGGRPLQLTTAEGDHVAFDRSAVDQRFNRTERVVDCHGADSRQRNHTHQHSQGQDHRQQFR